MHFTYFYTDNKHIQPALEFETKKHVPGATCWSRIPTPQQFRWFRLIHSKTPQTSSKFDQENQWLVPRSKFFLGQSKGLFLGAKRQTSCLRFQGVYFHHSVDSRCLWLALGGPSSVVLGSQLYREWCNCRVIWRWIAQKSPNKCLFGKSQTVYKCIIETKHVVWLIYRYQIGCYIDRLPN